MLCKEHTSFGSSKLVIDDPEKLGNKITMILAVFRETSKCEVAEETGTQGPGKVLNIKRTDKSVK